MEESEFYKAVGWHMKTRRELLRKSQEDVARAAGITRTLLSHYENGKRPAPAYTLSAVARSLGTKASAFLPEED